MEIWQRIFGLFSRRGASLARYRSGMGQAKRGNFQAAVDDYTSTIESKHVPADVKAMAMYNRSLAYSSLGKDDLAAHDLAEMLTMKGLPENIRTQAQQRRQRILKRERSSHAESLSEE